MYIYSTYLSLQCKAMRATEVYVLSRAFLFRHEQEIAKVINVYIYIHVYIYIFIHVYIYIYIHVCIYIYVYIYTCMNTHCLSYNKTCWHVG